MDSFYNWFKYIVLTLKEMLCPQYFQNKF